MVAAIKAMPTHDAISDDGSIRAGGCLMHPMYLFTVKRPSASSAP